MADLQRLAQALHAADAAGDTAAATALAGEIRRMQGAGEARPPRDPVVTARARAENPELYDPNYQYKNRGLLRDIGRAAVRAPLTAADATLNIGRQAVAAPVAGIAGLVTAPAGFIPGMEGVGARNVERVQSFLGGQPFTEGGRQVMDAAAVPGELLTRATGAAGSGVLRATGSPMLAAGVDTTLQSLPLLLGRGIVRRGDSGPVRPRDTVATRTPETGVPSAAQAERGRGLESVREAAPSIEELRTAKNAAYKAAEEAGVTVPGRDMTRFKVNLVKDMQANGLNKKLHPKAHAALQEILESPNEISLTKLETLRKIAGDVRMSPDKADARLGSRIIQKIDELEDSLSSDVPSFKEARALNQRLAKAETIERVFQSARRAVGANYTVAGLETALRQKFRSLIENDKKMRGFSKEERAAIDSFISGGRADNFLRKVGKFAPDGTISGWTAILASMANPALAIVPALGSVAKFSSTRRGMRNANRISEMVRGGPLPQRTRNSLAYETAE